jgi:hypothetical protein
MDLHSFRTFQLQGSSRRITTVFTGDSSADSGTKAEKNNSKQHRGAQSNQIPSMRLLPLLVVLVVGAERFEMRWHVQSLH